ncbi:MAG: hypothetical protein EBZ74_07295 [Planctomycetia bacterium]|nr:hypothetical protein [Planctomycetia bacterium]
MDKFHDVPMSFHQGCPVCGRLLRIRVTLLGRKVYCQHCGGGFIAAERHSGPAGGQEARDRRVADLIERAELALQRSAEPVAFEPPWRGGGSAWIDRD